LGIAILAEGVQNETQFERLLEMRCELGQGYFFSEPQPPTIIEGLLHRQINAEPVIDAGSAETGPMMERAPAAPAPADDDDGDSSPAPVVLPKLRKTTLPSKG
jgi:predicted signal transduction protein with EAL and GGDEF domain